MMKIETFMNQICAMEINDFIGVPDSTLKSFCDYLNLHVSEKHHFVPVNEGAAVALAAGIYLGEQKKSCVYMQNSGIGNAVNPITSLINEMVYEIPMLFVIGYRGEPGTKDEPQHKFQGEITVELLDCLAIPNAVIGKETTDDELNIVFQKAQAALDNEKQFAIVVKKDTFEPSEAYHFHTPYSLVREEAIEEILHHSQEEDLLVSTTGKISREVYEQSDRLFGNHERAFLTVGSMGHASMIALGIALKNPERQVICLDGDGAALMHMGSMAFCAQQNCPNLMHIVLNNEAHESVGGMPTNCRNISLKNIAAACGYKNVYQADTKQELQNILALCRNQNGSTYIEIHVGLGARDDLGRPKESAVENKRSFMKHIESKR